MLLDFSQENMSILFEITPSNRVALKHFSYAPPVLEDKDLSGCMISEIHISGENPAAHLGAKHAGSWGDSILQYETHRYYKNKYGNKLEFSLSGGKINAVVHYQFYTGAAAVRTWTVVTNISREPVGLEYVSSFSYTGLDENGLKIMIPHNSWAREASWRAYTPWDLSLQKTMATGSKRIAVSNTGTWSSKEHLPMAAAVSESGALMWQLENNGSWHWEISDVTNMLYLKISGPTEQENAWYHELMPGESFESVRACVTLGKDFDGALCEMTKYRRVIFENNAQNRALPVIFNDYMHCLWADPTEEKMLPLIDKAAEAGCEYYCMDAGWYADGTWWEAVGEWREQKKRFPGGIKRVFDYIKSKGMVPGIWLEIEVMGINCPIAGQFEDECFFMRHGKRVIDRGRYQLDFRNGKVRRFASAVVDRVVREYGAGFIKFDYNIDAGSGTEVDSASFGDGLLAHNRAYLGWIEEIKNRYPGLILENCSSGGMRLDYAMLAKHHIQSMTDQEDFRDTAYIAAAAPTAVLPEQAGIWAYPLSDNKENETAFLMTSALLQRVYLSGQITSLSEGNFSLVKEAIECYKQIRDDIPASIPFYPLGVPKTGDGVICLAFRCGARCRLAVWCFDEAGGRVQIPLACSNIKILYPSNSSIEAVKTEDGLAVTFPAAYTAAVIELMEREETER